MLSHYPVSNPREILELAYGKASQEIAKDNGASFFSKLAPRPKLWLETIANNSESLKAVVAALTTSLVKKIESPNQDVRLHKKMIRGGYSGRSLDTKYVTPFFKQKFRRLAMKESGWLTRSLEQPHPFTLDFPGKIRDTSTKQAFLSIIDDVEENEADPHQYLVGLFILLIHQMTRSQKEISTLVEIPRTLNISEISECLESYFSINYHVYGASKLPVIAIYSIYELLVKDVQRYKGKKLLPLESHLSPDARAGAMGDIQIVDGNNEFFEAVEIKHMIPIDNVMVDDAYQKFKNTPLKRYYLLTTAKPDVEPVERANVQSKIKAIRMRHGCEIIVNGVIPSLKYYLRLLHDPTQFLPTYTKNLKLQFSKSTEIKIKHIQQWEALIKTVLEAKKFS